MADNTVSTNHEMLHAIHGWVIAVTTYYDSGILRLWTTRTVWWKQFVSSWFLPPLAPPSRGVEPINKMVQIQFNDDH